jgi:hypothetical protein
MMNDSQYPWFILVPEVTGVTDSSFQDGGTRKRFRLISYELQIFFECRAVIVNVAVKSRC